MIPLGRGPVGQVGPIARLRGAEVPGMYGAIVVLAGRLMRQSPDVAAVASATSVGGSTVVLPLVERFGRKDLLLPGIVLGSLGNLPGTYIGFSMV